MEAHLSLSLDPIQAEIQRLWQAYSRDSQRKPCLFNLIVYHHGSRRLDYFKELIAKIQKQFPCRIIFIHEDDRVDETSLFTQASIEKQQDENQISSDLISIQVGKKRLPLLPFLILPLFIADLPIYLLWGQDFQIENPLFPSLRKFANRIVLDSETTTDLQVFSAKVLEQFSPSLPIIDMNWIRLGGWRDVLAQTFDSPQRLEQLVTAQEIQIYYNLLPSDISLHQENQAAYLQAWLASRIGWQWQRMERVQQILTIYYTHPEGMLSLQLIPTNQPKFASQEITDMKIFGHDGYQCHLKRGDNQVKVEAFNQFQCELPFSLFMPQTPSIRNFIQETFYHKISDHYLAMLQQIQFATWS